jgi:hypothetical protein
VRQDGAIQYEELVAWLCDTPCFSQCLGVLRSGCQLKMMGFGDLMDDPLELPSKWRFNNDNDDQLNGIVCQP